MTALDIRREYKREGIRSPDKLRENCLGNYLMRESRKTQSKDRAFVDLTCDRNCSAVGLHDFFDDGQAKSGATGVLCPCPIGPIKPLEEMWKMLRLDPMDRILKSQSAPSPTACKRTVTAPPHGV